MTCNVVSLFLNGRNYVETAVALGISTGRCLKKWTVLDPDKLVALG